jgi:uncharacterized DUF497 family protein
MRFDLDAQKSNRLRTNPKRGIGFEEAQEIFEQPHYLDQRSDMPEQYRAIGWVRQKLYALIFEIREDDAGEYYHSWHFGKRQPRSNNFMRSIRKKQSGMSAENIARLADKGEGVSRFFTNAGQMMSSIQRVNVDFASPMLDELDSAAKELNISRQAVIKTLIRQALDQHYLATARQSGTKQR